jgi:Helix-turn-helix domain
MVDSLELAQGEDPLVAENPMTIDEAVALTSMSRRALEGRIARGTLPAEKRGGRVFVDRADLERLRLIPQRADASKDAVISELLDRLERQAEEIATLKAEVRRLKRSR